MKHRPGPAIGDDLMAITTAVLMFVLQACMVLAISSNVLAGERTAKGETVSDHRDAGYPRMLA
ncbi:MAG: hypothetical protein HYR49_02665 [Gammaproteobacteria bacterium]|nr:hypothetical protein [Gammaproteobacteria bacterium]